MKPTLLLFLFFCCALSTGLMAQPQDVIEADELTVISNKIEDNITRLTKISAPLQVAKRTMKGIYLDSEWKSSAVYTKDNAVLNCSARFNIYKNRIEIKLGEEVRMLQANKVDAVLVNESLFIYLESGDEGLTGVRGFYEVLAEGKITLLKKYKLELYSSGGTALHPNLGNQKEYRNTQELFYGKEGEGAKKFKKGKKGMEELFGANYDKIKAFADENKIGFKKEKDLIQIFDWYNKAQ